MAATVHYLQQSVGVQRTLCAKTIALPPIRQLAEVLAARQLDLNLGLWLQNAFRPLTNADPVNIRLWCGIVSSVWHSTVSYSYSS